MGHVCLNKELKPIKHVKPIFMRLFKVKHEHPLSPITLFMKEICFFINHTIKYYINVGF